MLGATVEGRILLVPIEPLGVGNLWRPVTAFVPRPEQAARLVENADE
jgi:hypothetical protein